MDVADPEFGVFNRIATRTIGLYCEEWVTEQEGRPDMPTQFLGTPHALYLCSKEVGAGDAALWAMRLPALGLGYREDIHIAVEA